MSSDQRPDSTDLLQECFRLIFRPICSISRSLFLIFSQRLHFFQQRFQRLPQLRRLRQLERHHLVRITL